MFTVSPDGFRIVDPRYYYRFHGWVPQIPVPRSRVKAIYGGVYMRLVKKNPNGVDDRHLARYVAHVASDMKDANGHGGSGFGPGRYKMIPQNGDWMPINFITKISRTELDNNPPPFPTQP
jgi:hypothetical protein